MSVCACACIQSIVLCICTSISVYLCMCICTLVVVPSLYACMHRYLKLEKEANSLTTLRNNERLLHLMKKLQHFEELNEITVSHLKASTVNRVHTQHITATVVVYYMCTWFFGGCTIMPHSTARCLC